VDLRERHYTALAIYETTSGAEFSRQTSYDKWEFLAAPYLRQRARLLPSLQLNP
jgi:hypothetical protein